MDEPGESAILEVDGWSEQIESAAEPPSIDRVFELLSNRRRRFVVHVLARADGHAMAFGDLVEAVVTIDADLDGPPATAERRREVATALYTTHFPRLEDAGVLEWDVRSRTVRYWRQPTVEKWAIHAVELARRGWD